MNTPSRKMNSKTNERDQLQLMKEMLLGVVVIVVVCVLFLRCSCVC